MDTFNIGETVTIYNAVTKGGVAYSPTDGCTVAIYDEDDTAILAAAAMTEEDTGEYSYDWDSTGNDKGRYKAKVTGDDGTKISIEFISFRLV